jgi:hypothetical protein
LLVCKNLIKLIQIMNKITEEEIIQFLKEETYEDSITSETDVFNECGVDGDDCDELLFKYSEKYLVDMSDFLWYFHYQEEGSINFKLGSLFFKNPHQRVKTIPITPKMLTDFANSKIWKIDYPEHKLPKYRYDMIINYIVLSIIFIWLINSLIRKYF